MRGCSARVIDNDKCYSTLGAFVSAGLTTPSYFSSKLLIKGGNPELRVRWWTSDWSFMAGGHARHDIPSTKRIVVVKGFMLRMKIDGKDGEYGKFKLAG